MNPNATALDDLVPLVFIGPEPAALAVTHDTDIGDISTYLDTLKEAPGSIINGNDSPGGFSYIAAAMLENQFDVELTKIPPRLRAYCFRPSVRRSNVSNAAYSTIGRSA
ncbi:hypothetical protein HORIV_65120 [Vreelandella olivaria]|uniref:Uncharacterized protein n=1 Tax=Vreelandella olivaria TaxID=390919 RepID=A0ABM7GTS3_9GAMM|nr:hypothetical protein HORIV_65120 [Halomonas olivaria]